MTVESAPVEAQKSDPKAVGNAKATDSGGKGAELQPKEQTTTALSTSTWSSLLDKGKQAIGEFKSYFGNKAEFSEAATKVDSIDKLTFDSAFDAKSGGGCSAKSGCDLAFASQAAKAADINWMVPGDNKPGGDTSLVADGKKVDARGKNKDGVDVHAEVTKAGQKVTAGDVTYEHSENGGVKVKDKEFEITKKDGITTVDDEKNHRKVVFDEKNHTYTVVDETHHESTTYSAQGARTKLGENKEVTQTTGSAIKAAEQEQAKADNPSNTTRYFQDAEGNMAAVKADGTVFKYHAKEHVLEISKGDQVIKRDFHSHSVTFYERDAKGNLVQKTPDAQHLPAGWEVQKDGSIKIDGRQVVNGSDSKVQIEEGGSFDRLKKRLETETENGKAQVQSEADGKGTKLSGPGAPEVEVKTNGQMKETTTPGAPPITFDAHKQEMQIQGTDGGHVTMHTTASGGTDTKLYEPNGRQYTDISDTGSVSSYSLGADGKWNSLFSASSGGDLNLYDGTQISSSGFVFSASRGIRESGLSGGRSGSRSSDGTSEKGDGPDGQQRQDVAVEGGFTVHPDGSVTDAGGSSYGSLAEARAAAKANRGADQQEVSRDDNRSPDKAAALIPEQEKLEFQTAVTEVRSGVKDLAMAGLQDLSIGNEGLAAAELGGAAARLSQIEAGHVPERFKVAAHSWEERLHALQHTAEAKHVAHVQDAARHNQTHPTRVDDNSFTRTLYEQGGLRVVQKYLHDTKAKANPESASA